MNRKRAMVRRISWSRSVTRNFLGFSDRDSRLNCGASVCMSSVYRAIATLPLLIPIHDPETIVRGRELATRAPAAPLLGFGFGRLVVRLGQLAVAPELRGVPVRLIQDGHGFGG